MKTIGHHTCKLDGGEEYILKEAPFVSKYEFVDCDDEIEKTVNNPFLGTGYYFWDNNEDTAKWWGSRHYKSGYFIVKSDLNIDGGTFLDLVGNRACMLWLKSMIDELHNLGYDRSQWTLGMLIETLKEIKAKTSEEAIFPYNVIRTIDYGAKHKSNYHVSFVPGKKGFTVLDPRLIICVLEKSNLIIQSVKIIYDSTK